MYEDYLKTSNVDKPVTVHQAVGNDDKPEISTFRDYSI